MDSLTLFLHFFWERLILFADEPGKILFGTMVAAFAGTWGAHRIITRNKSREDTINEIRNTNAAIALAIAIANQALEAKKQQILPLKQNYEFQKAQFDRFLEERANGNAEADAPRDFSAELNTLPPLICPIEALQSQVYTEISVIGRPLIVIATLAGVIQSLNRTIEARNTLIQTYKDSRLGTDELARLYFGAPDDSQIDTNYPDIVEAIYTQNDDCIFFSSRLLCSDLIEYGKNLRKKLGNPPDIEITEADFESVRELIPNDSDYQSWFDRFRPPT